MDVTCYEEWTIGISSGQALVNLFKALQIVSVFTKNKKEWNSLFVENLGVYKIETLLLLVIRHSVSVYISQSLMLGQCEFRLIFHTVWLQVVIVYNRYFAMDDI
jgi:hypothetical protein